MISENRSKLRSNSAQAHNGKPLSYHPIPHTDLDSTNIDENGNSHYNSHEQTMAHDLTMSDIEMNREEFVKQYYGYIALIAGLLIGVQSFLYEVVVYTEVSTQSFTLYTPLFVGYFSFYAFYHIKEAISMKAKYGKFWMKERSSYFKCAESQPFIRFGSLRQIPPPAVLNASRTYVLNKFNVITVGIRAFFGICASQLIMIIMYTETLANLNFSLIANILALTPFIAALLFYVLFRENLNKIYLLGITLIISCAILTSLSTSKSTSDTVVQYLTPLVPVILAVVQATLVAIICLITRYIVVNSEITIYQVVSDTFFFEGLVYLMQFLIFGYDYSYRIFFSIAAIGMISLSANMLINFATSYGKAAPSLALNNCSSIYTLGLEILILQKIPSTLQIVAFGLGLTGALMIAFESRKQNYHQKK